MSPEDLLAALEKLGATMKLSSQGPVFTMPPRDALAPEGWTRLNELRRILSRHRDLVIRHLGGDPAQYRWVPMDGTEERTWYDCLEESIKQPPGTITGHGGRSWHTRRDAERLLASCANTDGWRRDARAFWWDYTHQQKWQADDYSWPLLQG